MRDIGRNAAVSRNGEYIVAVDSKYSTNQGIYFYKWNNSNPLWWYNETGFKSVAISADGNHVVASREWSEWGEGIYYWNNTRSLSGSQPFTWNSTQLLVIGDLDISDNGTIVAACMGFDVGGEVLYYTDCTSKSGTGIVSDWGDYIGDFTSPWVLDLSPNGKYLAVGGQNESNWLGFVKFYKDAWSGKASSWVNDTMPFDIADICVSDDGYAVVAIDEVDDSLFYWANSTDLTGNPAANWTRPGPFKALDISSDGDEVAATTTEVDPEELFFWNESRTLSGEPPETWKKQDATHYEDVAVNDDGTLIASIGGEDVWNLIIYSSDGTTIYNYTTPYYRPEHLLYMSGEGDVLAAVGSLTVFGIADLDYGDAPDVDEYGTVDGARHLIDGVTYLGASVDPDPDGQPDPDALGDDNDGQDDEDGVLFTTPLIKGSTAGVNVTASTAGYLNAWMDFDGDWCWDYDEQIFVNESLIAGINSLTFMVPADSNETTFARFRFSTESGLDPWGGEYEQGIDPYEYAPDGEVEDYKVSIYNPPTLTAENPEIADQTLNISVCTEFNVEIWIRNITEGYSMVGFDFLVEWDPALTEYVEHTVFDHGWSYTFGLNEAGGVLWFDYSIDTSHTYTEDDIWANVTFHCLGEGVSEVNVTSVDTIWLWDGENIFGVDPAPYGVTCNQTRELQESKAVGGEVLLINSRILCYVLTIAAASTIIALIKTRDKQKSVK